MAKVRGYNCERAQGQEEERVQGNEGTRLKGARVRGFSPHALPPK